VVDVGSASIPTAIERLALSCRRAGSPISIGLEPCEEYLPAGFRPDIGGYERFLRTVVDATAGQAAAYKFNLAFFEALGASGVELLYRVRQQLPPDTYVIADAKRCDIGSSARRYAQALYESLGADAATVNPLLGRDSVEPFLEYSDRLSFLLALTSNPGAADFLAPGALYRRIAEAASAWNTRQNCGLVVGATQASLAAEIRKAAPSLPFLVPGVGAQGGDLRGAAKAARAPEGNVPVLFHVTRGILPDKGKSCDPAAAILEKTRNWRSQINEAVARVTGGTIE